MHPVPSSENDVTGPSLKDAGASGGIESLNDSAKLVYWQGVALLTADCVGVGVLALPNAVKVLGYWAGLGFLLLNFPINYFAGDLLSTIGLSLESQDRVDCQISHQDTADKTSDVSQSDSSFVDEVDEQIEMTTPSDLELNHRNSPSGTATKSPPDSSKPAPSNLVKRLSSGDETFQDEPDARAYGSIGSIGHNEYKTDSVIHHSVDDLEHVTPTNDLIAMSRVVFEHPGMTNAVRVIYYLNLFLVLGDYILVMTRAVSALFLGQICMPVAGAIASVLMFGICQLRTMALLGRTVSLASLLAMVVVLLMCLFHHRTNQNTAETPVRQEYGVWSKFSAMASIGFAVGSQKLFLNIRHELQDKREASKVLAGGLTTYGCVYFLVIVLAGPQPPSLLFDAVPAGWSRRVAGFLLWGHVAVSYAINSQALCSSLDRTLLSYHGVSTGIPSWFVRTKPQLRWFILTFVVALSSYLVSNAVPFFKDLVALIGALTSVPLTLTLPALLYRKFHQFSLFLPSPGSMGTYTLMGYSLAFLAVGLTGAISSINEDWLSHGSPFSCS
eukprot:Nitzschia sp. Nitz4//scaffold6_size259037//246584//248324//NITZ4_001127-RA/size259037-augustus-gene-0.311-mRNA-1//1//CDS//3329557052//3921//frame0